MLSKIVSRHGVQALALVLLILALLISVGSGNLPLLQATPVQAAAPAAAFTCTPVTVAAFDNRVDVACTTGSVDGASLIYWFAVPTTNAGNAARYLSLFTTAKVTGRDIVVWYTPGDTSGAAWGCGAADCRAISGVRLY